jgi:hypothetical protein
MKLRGKVNLALMAAFAVGLILAGGGAYKVLTDEAVDNSARDARIAMEQASAIRTYTAEAIRPLLESQMKVQFLPHAIPSYAAQTNFRLVQKKLPEYSYREPALNPTNVNDRALDWEAAYQRFRERADKTETMVVRETPGQIFDVVSPAEGRLSCLPDRHSTRLHRPPWSRCMVLKTGWVEARRNHRRSDRFDPDGRAVAAGLQRWLADGRIGGRLSHPLIVDTLLRVLVVKAVRHLEMASDE